MKTLSKKITKIEMLPAILFSIFSIIFSMSIVKELYSLVEVYFLIVLSVFIASFLIYNEVVKVRELRNLFAGKKYSRFLLAITMVLSISLSTIGIYFWVNKSYNIDNTILVNKSNELLDVEQTTISNLSFESTAKYNDLKENIKYWKSKSAGSLIERTEIRERINDYQNTLIKAENKYNVDNTNTNDLLKESKINAINAKYDKLLHTKEHNSNISLIFLVLILITEGLIVMLNRDLSIKCISIDKYNDTSLIKNYRLFKTILTSIYITAKKENTINIGNFMHSLINTTDGKKFNIEFDQMKTFYNALHTIGVIKIMNGKGHAKILKDKREGLNKMDTYYELVYDSHK